MLQRLKKIFTKDSDKKGSNIYGSLPSSYHSYVQSPGKAVWLERNYSKFADEGYKKNVICYKAVSIITSAAASVPLKITSNSGDYNSDITIDGLSDILKRPNPRQSISEFMEEVFAYKLISGNSYIMAVGPNGEAPRELYVLRPDRVSVVVGKDSQLSGYRYTIAKDSKANTHKDYQFNSDGHCKVLHLKNFNPLNDWYGMSCIEAAAYSIDQHNQAADWNQALMQNGARPSGALIVRPENDGGSHLTEDQYNRLKVQIDDQFMGSINAGRPLLLEGGLEWKEMSLSPRDMDFIKSKDSSARDIALAFGLPPQLLGIPGDNTYSNLAEARLAMWEQTVIPMVKSFVESLNYWLAPQFDRAVSIAYDLNNIPALAPRREALWKRVKDAEFLSDEEKRKVLGGVALVDVS